MQEKYKQIKDEELVALAQASDEFAEETLIRKYKKIIKYKAHLYFVVGADSEDLMQEGMIGLFKAIRSYKSDKNASFRTYAEICINSQIVSAVRQSTRLKNSPLNTSISIDWNGFDDDNDVKILDGLTCGINGDPEAILIMKEKMEGLGIEGKSFFSELESKVLVEILKGKNYNDIGKMMGKTPKSIDNAIQRIRKKLEIHLKRV